MRFLTGQPTVIPTIADYDPLDQGLVVAQAAKLSQMGGDYHAALDGSAKFLKVDIALNAKNYLSLRGNTSKFEGAGLMRT
jgi:hypothetical protein